MNKKTIRDLDVKGKKVLVRVDFNVPLEGGQVRDDTRMKKALPTIKTLLEKGAAVILVTHLGRPKGKVVPDMSVWPLVSHLGNMLGTKVLWAADCGGDESRKLAAEIKPGQVALLENVRFYPGEEKNDPEYAKNLASLADLYVNDAFGTAHRAHASTEGVAHYLPAVAGLLLEKEVSALAGALHNAEHPFVSILGGAKVSDKISVMANLLNKVDTLLIGGGMANTFLKAQGLQTGKSLVEADKLDLAGEILKKAADTGAKIMLPQDVVVADRFAADAQAKVVPAAEIPEDWMVLDIGPATVRAYAKEIMQAKTVVWNGPLGVYEFDKFAVGTNEIARVMAETQAKTIIGGGDVVAAIEKTGVAAKISHVSTGGGASLAFLEGKILPGIAALMDV